MIAMNWPSPRARWKRFLLPIVVLIALGAASATAAVIAAKRAQLRATLCLTQVRALVLDQAKWADAKDLMARFPGSGFNPDSGQCGPKECIYRLLFTNYWLEKLHLAPRVELIVGITIISDRFVSRGFSYTSYGDASEWASAVVNEDAGKPGEKPFVVYTMNAMDGRPNKLIIHFTSMASERDRESAYNVDLSCLSKIGGCRDRNRILPHSGVFP
jgi:hypothetical protein